MKRRYGIIIVSVLFGLLVWVIDAGFDFFIFYEEGFLDLLILDVPSHEIYIRTVFFLCFVAFGVFASFMTGRRRLVEKELLDSEKQLRSILETATDAVISADSGANIIFWNKGAERIFGYSPEEIIGRQITVIMPERYRELAVKGYRRVVETGKTRMRDRAVEVYGLRKDGSEFPVELSLARWDTEDGVFFTSIIRDITERKQAREQIENLARFPTETSQVLTCFRCGNALKAGLCRPDGVSARRMSLARSNRWRKKSNAVGRYSRWYLRLLSNPATLMFTAWTLRSANGWRLNGRI
jgi:PAS domain S-box-containing protein